MCWARAIRYVFCQIYAGEHDVEESFQPMPMSIPGLLPISPTDGYFQPSTLKDICADHVYKHAGKYWSMGPDVTGCNSVSSIVHFLRRRQVTGSTQAACVFVHRMQHKKNPSYLRYLQIQKYYPRSPGQWLFWKKAVTWAIGMIVHGGEFAHPTYVHLHPNIPQFFKTRLDWVIKQYRHARRQRFAPIYEIECTTCA